MVIIYSCRLAMVPTPSFERISRIRLLNFNKPGRLKCIFLSAA